MTDHSKEIFKNIFKIGTPECAVFMGIVGLALGVMFLLLGFWQTILVALIAAAFAFIGGVKNKKEYVGKLVDRIFPQKNDNFPGIENAGRRRPEPPMTDFKEIPYSEDAADEPDSEQDK